MRPASPQPWRNATRGAARPTATARNALCDSARRRYVKATFNAAVDDPGAYDAVLNLGRMSLDTAVDLVAALVHRAETRAPHPSLIPASLAGPAG